MGRVAAKQTAERIAERIQARIGIEYHWDGDDLRFGRTGVSGRFRVSDDDVRFELDLQWILRGWKGRIERRAHEILGESFRSDEEQRG